MKTSLRRRASLGLVVGVLSLLSQSPATAHDHRAPRTSLRADAQKQPGYVVERTWVRRAGPTICVANNVLFPLRFPGDRVKIPAGQAPVIRLEKSQFPHDLSVTAWRRVREGKPRGAPQTLPFTLVPLIARDGRISAWDVQLQPLVEERSYFLMLEAHWSDENGCGSPVGADQALWTTYSLKVR